MGQIHPWAQSGCLPLASMGTALPYSKAERSRWTHGARCWGGAGAVWSWHLPWSLHRHSAECRHGQGELYKYVFKRYRCKRRGREQLLCIFTTLWDTYFVQSFDELNAKIMEHRTIYMLMGKDTEELDYTNMGGLSIHWMPTYSHAGSGWCPLCSLVAGWQLLGWHGLNDHHHKKKQQTLLGLRQCWQEALTAPSLWGHCH